MKHFAHPDFWAALHSLPPEVQELAHKNFELMKADERHPSIRLKKVGQLWSGRVGRDYRALAQDRKEGLLWFWIGPHQEYDKLLG
ncbi:MAG: hypothetical protein JNM99_18595 [Verrucomicrobiaceae bacterium]|nr:hypothetical protein [Verrucomicrobiaceae bacterium]